MMSAKLELLVLRITVAVFAVTAAAGIGTVVWDAFGVLLFAVVSAVLLTVMILVAGGVVAARELAFLRGRRARGDLNGSAGA